MEHFIIEQSRAFLGRREPESNTIEFAELSAHAVAYLIFSPMTTLRTPLKNLDFVTAPETSQVNNFNNLPVNVIKAGRVRGC